MVKVIDAKDFAAASFKVAINRIQQVALDKASAKIPCPADQLKLLHERSKKAQERDMNLSWVYKSSFFYFYILIDLPEFKRISQKSQEMSVPLAKEVRAC